MVGISKPLVYSATFVSCISAAVVPKTPRNTNIDTISPNVLALTRKIVPGIIRHKHRYGSANVTAAKASFGQVFLTDIKFGTEVFQVVVDTGSSDTWLVESDFKCSSVSPQKPVAESQCAFGPTYNDTKTLSRIPNENFNITYGDGETLTGYLAHEDVTLAGIEVKRQEVGIVNFAAWYGDGISSGLLGLAFPSLTSGFAGNNPALDGKNNSINFNPIFTTMAQEHLVSPVFSLALSRTNETNGSGGFLAIGGLPPVSFEQDFAKTPIQKTPLNDITGIGPSYQFYTINVDGLEYKNVEKTNFTSTLNTSSHSAFQVFVDSGTPSIELPTVHANAFNAHFNPPALYSNDLDAYVTHCNASVPEFGVKIGGKTFYVNPVDNLVPLNDGSGNCTTGVTDGGDGLGVLGDVFLKNVVAVFDLAALEMRFARRECY